MLKSGNSTGAARGHRERPERRGLFAVNLLKQPQTNGEDRDLLFDCLTWNCVSMSRASSDALAQHRGQSNWVFVGPPAQAFVQLVRLRTSFEYVVLN